MTKTLSYLYSFSFPDQKTVSFAVALDAITLGVTSCPAPPPTWARLEYHRCAPCPLLVEEHPYCPVALSVADLVTAFKDTFSYTACTVSCISAERTVTKSTNVQDGLTSILGLLMATSGCPVMDFFKPLARFHLPFSTVEESIFRFITAYLLKQYYLNDYGKDGRLSLHEIKSHFTLVKQVNCGILERIQNITDRDADKNAIVTLSSLTQILEMEIDENLESLQYLFIKT